MQNLLSLGLVIALAGTFPSGNKLPDLEAIYPRSILNQGDLGRLEHVFERALKGEPISVAVIGGSITEGAHAEKVENRWGNQMANWWKVNFPTATITYHNAGIGATGSDIGVHRAAKHLLVHKPDIVGIEFSVNDGGAPIATEWMEGLVRQILRQPNAPAVFLLSMMSERGGNVQSFHLPVSKYYNLPHISYRDALFPEMQAKTIIWKDISPDNIHPNAIGHTYAAALVNRFLSEKLEAFKAAKRPAADIPSMPDKPLVGTTFDNGDLQDMNTVKILENNGFKPSKDHYWKDGFTGEKPGDKITFEIDAPTIGIIFKRSNKAMGHARVIVDGKQTAVLEAWFNQTWRYTPHHQIIRNQPGKHVITIEIMNEKNAGSEGNAFEICTLTIAK
ncbi:MAG: SGNH/GDSL hydrolase family protein [Lentisphaeria bacterium]|nr:SGNH/GDSL hydrolase family protein [Lentisphaeria bacterium]